MFDNFVLLPWETYHTSCYIVRPMRKTTHPAYQETNAVASPGQTYKIGYPSLQL
jgi:antirestriction protein ArdC